MVEYAADYEWRGDGEEAEISLYAPDAATAERAFEQALPAARLPGALSPVYAASSDGLRGFGWAAASETHAAPDLASGPEWSLLLVAGAPVESLGAPEEVPRLIERNLSEVALPEIGEAGVRRLCELGPLWAAEEGLIEEEDLPLFSSGAGDADALGRRSLFAGARDWTRPGRVQALRVAQILDSEGAGELGLEPGALALVVSAGAEDLGRLAFAAHRERILARILDEDFDAPAGLPAAPVDYQEARDLVEDLFAAARAATNYSAGRAALVLYALRRALRDAGALDPRAAWEIGGIQERDGQVLHRNGLAAAGAGEVLVAGRTVAVGTGVMLGSAPPFEAPEESGRWVWEEAGILARLATLEPLGL